MVIYAVVGVVVVFLLMLWAVIQLRPRSRETHKHHWRCVRTVPCHYKLVGGLCTEAMWICTDCGKRRQTQLDGWWKPDDLNGESV